FAIKSTGHSLPELTNAAATSSRSDVRDRATIFMKSRVMAFFLSDQAWITLLFGVPFRSSVTTSQRPDCPHRTAFQLPSTIGQGQKMRQTAFLGKNSGKPGKPSLRG